MELIKEENVYKNKENNQIVYLYGVGNEIAKMITIKTKKFNINRISKYMPIKKFHTEYEAYNGEDVYDYIEYFQNVLELKELMEEMKKKEEKIANLINEKRNIYYDVENYENEKHVKRIYLYKNNTLKTKSELANALKISLSTLDIHIEKNNLDHYYLSEEDVEKIIRSLNETKTNKNIYEYNEVKASSVSRFLYLLGISYTSFKKWKDKNGYDKDKLTKKEFVEDLIEFSKD